MVDLLTIFGSGVVAALFGGLFTAFVKDYYETKKELKDIREKVYEELKEIRQNVSETEERISTTQGKVEGFIEGFGRR